LGHLIFTPYKLLTNTRHLNLQKVQNQNPAKM